MALCAAAGNASGAQFGSPDYFNQLSNRQGTASGAATQAQTLPMSSLAQQIAKRSAADLAQAARAIAAAQAAQAAARSVAASQAPPVPDGLVPGGLQVDPGIGTDPSLWQNALKPVVTKTGGNTTVTIDQTDAKAILTWVSFNVGQHTTVFFNQVGGTDAAGNNLWVALNRIEDPSGVPSEILGSIKAQGSVYLIDRNGIIFGGTSQVDVHGLVATSLDIGELGQSTDQRNEQFLHNGLNIDIGGSLTALNNQNVAFSTTTDPLDASQNEGAVTVAAGAQITTSIQGSDNPGSVMLLAPKVSNAGTIESPAGQVILGAGRVFAFLENTQVGGTSHYLGLVVQSEPSLLLQASPYGTPPLPDYLPGMAVENSGLIDTNRGNITLQGTTVENDGVLAATTSITRNGSIVVQGVTDVTFGPNASASILPDPTAAASESIPQGQVSATTFPAPYVQIQATEIQTGSSSEAVIGVGTLTFDSGASVVAPGATVGLFGGQTVYLSQDTLIDVAGLTSAVLPMSANFVTFEPRGPEFADSPLQRNGPLRGTSLIFDIRESGISPDGLSWVGTPLADAAGYVANIPEGIGQLLAKGGTVSISTALGANPQNYSKIVLQPGSTIDVSGGFVTYQGGAVATTRLLGADGAVYAMADADPNLPYLGIAGTFTDNHPRWAVSQTYGSPLIEGSPSTFQPGYIEGHDAGGVELRADAIVEAGTLLGQVAAGPHQLADGQIGTASSTIPGDTRHLQANAQQLPSAGYLILDPSSIADSSIGVLVDGVSVVPAFVLIRPDPVVVPAGLGPNTPLPANFVISNPADPFSGLNPADLADTLVLSSSLLDAGGFAEITIPGTTRETAGATLTVADGGSISISGLAIDIRGAFVARAGSISLVSNGGGFLAQAPGTPSITIDAGAILDVSGRWVNDTGLTEALTGPGYINGGSIGLLSDARSKRSVGGSFVDTTGSIVVDPAALLDVSSGGYVEPSGKLMTSGGVVAGAGGNISLETYLGGFSVTGSSGAFFPASPDLVASVSVDPAQSIRAFGFATGGTFTLLVGPSVDITNAVDTLTTATDGTLLIPSAMFGTNNPFGAFDIGSDGGSVIVVAGTHVVLRQSNYQAGPRSYVLPTDGDGFGLTVAGETIAPIGLTPQFQRRPVDLTLSPGNGDVSGFPNAASDVGRVVVQKGASIVSAPNGAGGAEISLVGTYQVDVLGRITAPGGTVTLDATGSVVPGGLAELGGASVANGAVFLGPSGEIDVAGEAVIDTTNALYRSGAVLGGGSVTLEATAASDKNGSIGYVATAAGSEIDLDGASTSLQYPLGGGPLALATATVSSDAGGLTIDATGAVLTGQVQANGGGPGAANGVLTFTANVAATVEIIQGKRTLPEGFTPGEVLTQLSGGKGTQHFIKLSADLLDASAFDDINFGEIPATDPAAASGIQRVEFIGDIDLAAQRAMRFYAPIEVLASGKDASPDATVSAPYLLLASTFNNQTAATEKGIGTFSAAGDVIVLQRGLVDAGLVVINSAGDVVVEGLLNTRAAGVVVASSGGLIASGDLVVDAARVYPAGGNQGVLQALGFENGTAGTSKLVILSDSAASTPFSAGGALYLLADDIVQDGTVWAPGGQIVLANSATPAEFAFLGTTAAPPTLVDAQSVKFGPGSLTSVSLGGLDLPYGGTVDGSAWYYADPLRENAPLTSTPAKQISVEAGAINLESGATIDLSGGGDLYASEFVPGNGGTRDVLSTLNAYGSTPFNPGLAGNVASDNPVAQVYAILPNYGSGAAPSDIDFSTATGLGLQGTAPGFSVYLSGIAGLKAGTYTLLPAAYATLPGAYRVVVTGQAGFLPGQNEVLPDGSYLMSGELATPMAGEQSSVPLAFMVQSSAVWRQYSEIDQTGANSFFASHAIGSTVRLPEDAGHLVLAATQSINLAGTLDSSAPAGALSSEVDISAADIEVVDPGQAARAGYVALNADQLSGLDAGSLLIGGSRVGGLDGDVITATANSIVVANDAAHPLAGPEILLVTTGVAGATDSDSKTGLLVEAGAVVEARGSASGVTPTDFVIGSLPAAAGTTGVAGDGAFLAVGIGGAFVVDRVNVPGQTGSSFAGPPGGQLTIDDGAEIAGNAVMLNTANAGSIADTAHIEGSYVTLAAEALSFGAAPIGTPGFVLSAGNLAAFSGARTLELESYTGITFYGPVTLDLAAPGATLVLNAGGLTATGDNVDIGAATVLLENSLGVAFTGGAGGSALTISGGTIELGNGTLGLAGIGEVQLQARVQVEGVGTGRFDAGAATVTVTAPLVLAGVGSSETLATTGAVTLAAVGSAALPDSGSALGGSLTIDGATVAVDTTVDAASGTIRLEASAGDLTLQSGARLIANGYARSFFDVTRYAAGGTIDLVSDTGNVVAAAGSEISVAGASGGGDAGTLDIEAPSGAAQLGGTLLGTSSDGLGGSLIMRQQAGATLDTLAAALSAGGFRNTVSVETATGDLALSGVLTAYDVTLIADAGAVTIASTGEIDASGDRGGTIRLYGDTGVDVEGKLLAEGSDPHRAGGTVLLGTGGVFAGTYNATYGYENDSSAGPLTIGPQAVINVSGGTIDGLAGGIVDIRVPLLQDGTIDLNVPAGAQITGAHDLIVEAYATWKTSDATSGALHFDGIVDPAGWYGDNGQLLAGFTQTGTTIAAGGTLQPGQYFTPNSPNMDHVLFYQQTLMGFVQGFAPTPTGSTAGLANAEYQPGIDLENGTSAVENGNITIASNWNLGAGGYDQSGNLTLFYRTAAGQPGDLTLRAANNVIVDATISDGFFQPLNFLDPRYLSALRTIYLPLAPSGNSTQGFYVEPLQAPAAPYDTTDTTYSGFVSLYYATYRSGYAQTWAAYDALSQQLYFVNGQLQPVPTGAAVPVPPAAPNYLSPATYGAASVSYTAYAAYYAGVYAQAYGAYLGALGNLCTSCAVPLPPAILQPPPAYGATMANQTGVFSVASSLAGQYGANGPADNPTGADPNPVMSADLFPLAAGGGFYRSWSYTIVGGADTSSADPLALLPASQFAPGSGSVTLNGHNTFNSSLSPVTGLVPVIIRTGTGSIDIAAGYNFSLSDPLAPGTVYTAGHPSDPLPSPGYVAVNGGSALNGPNSIAANTTSENSQGTLGSGAGATEIADPTGFDAPDFGDSFVLTAPTLFAVTTPAYSEGGGHVAITAQNDITGIQNIPATSTYTLSSAGYLTQFWTAWLFTRSVAVPALDGSQNNFDAGQGVYNPNAPHHGATFNDLNDGQTTWWINFGSFDQGVAALGGGDVTITAGRNIVDFSASTASSGRVSGGLSATALPALHLSGGGDLTVTAGGNIVSGSYYAALGVGKITAGGSIEADPSWSYTYADTLAVNAAQISVFPATIIAVGDAQISVAAKGSINIGDIVNPTEIKSGITLTVGDDYIADHGGASSLALATGTWTFQEGQFNTMSPDSAVSVESVGGQIAFETLPQQSTDNRNRLYVISQRLLPAGLDLAALSGSISVLSNFNLVNSGSGVLDILAEQNVRFANLDDSSGLGATETIPSLASSAAAGIATYQTQRTQTIATRNPIPGLVDTQFDPENPAAGFDTAVAGYAVLHTPGESLSHVYAATGDVTNGPVPDASGAVAATTLPMPLLTDEPIDIQAGRDILNLQLYAENIGPADVSTVSAGRDILYDLPSSNELLTKGSNGANLIELAGPGSLVVSAGRNLGPFPNDFNVGPSGIETTGDVAWITGYQDPLLSAKGASVYAFAGVGPGIDYQAVIQDYISPDSIGLVPHNYLPELVAYLGQTFGETGLTEAQAWRKFQSLTPDQQDAFADVVFFDELEATQQNAATPTYSRGYRMVNTMFPGSDGYTQNDLTGGANGSNAPIHTGTLDLRSATIQTRHGGNISVFAPGGDVLLGSSAARAVYNQPGTTGILTFQGGSISLFSDQSIIVNQSRILTEEGGDVLVWSSNGNILAGIGAKTSAEFPPYTVLYDADAIEQLDPGGLVTGAGIGALVTLPGQDPDLSNAFLFAPRGTVDAGDAGIRVAGNLVVAALHVANASNIQVGGTAVGVPTAPSVNVGALASAGAVAANAGRDTEGFGGGGGGQGQQAPSIIIIDVLGFGGE